MNRMLQCIMCIYVMYYDDNIAFCRYLSIILLKAVKEKIC